MFFWGITRAPIECSRGILTGNRAWLRKGNIEVNDDLFFHNALIRSRGCAMFDQTLSVFQFLPKKLAFLGQVSRCL